MLHNGYFLGEGASLGDTMAKREGCASFVGPMFPGFAAPNHAERKDAGMFVHILLVKIIIVIIISSCYSSSSRVEVR